MDYNLAPYQYNGHASEKKAFYASVPLMVYAMQKGWEISSLHFSILFLHIQGMSLFSFTYTNQLSNVGGIIPIVLPYKCNQFWENILHVIIWGVWRKMNNRIFQNKSRSSEEVIEAILRKVGNWLVANMEFKGVSLLDFVRD